MRNKRRENEREAERGEHRKRGTVKTWQLGREEGGEGIGGENKRKKEMKSYKTHLEKM